MYPGILGIADEVCWHGMGLLRISHVSRDTKCCVMKYAGMVWDYRGFPMYPGILNIAG